MERSCHSRSQARVEKAEVIRNIKIEERHHVLLLKNSRLARNARPGQFLNVRCTQGTAPLLRRPFGVHSISRAGVSILFKIVGNGTAILAEKKPGDELDIIGPLGRGFDITTKHKKIFLVAGGHGVAPLYAVCELAKKNKDITLFIGGRSSEHIVGVKQFRKLGIKVRLATDDGSAGRQGLVTDILKEQLPADKTLICACGPRPMLKVVARLAAEHDIDCQVSMEEYLGCGIGVCVGCAVETKNGRRLICKDGPVFDARELVW